MIASVVGRTLIASLFIFAGTVKIITPQIYLDHMIEVGVPTFLFPGVIALELGAGLALLIGFRVREAAGALGFFCILTAVIFHHDFASKVERTSFAKDLAIAGGLIAMAAAAEASRRQRSPKEQAA
jgi:putative oxidoreductase